jgi:hypothetical protein
MPTRKIFGCSKRSLMMWVDKYKSLIILHEAYKISNSHISFISYKLGKNKTITMGELLTKLKQNIQN